MTKSADDGLGASMLERGLWACLALGAVGVLTLAATLEPNPLGYGTHTKLGLPPCGFRSLTGTPCPGCGLTTAFAHAVRGHWVPALQANPLGLVLFVGVCASVPLAAVGAWRGWSIEAAFERFALGRVGFVVAGCAGALWVARLTAAL